MLDFILAGIVYLVAMFLAFFLVSLVVLGGSYALVLAIQRLISRIRRPCYSARLML